MEKNLIHIYNTIHYEHAIRVFKASDKSIGTRNAKELEVQKNFYFTYNLNETFDFALFNTKIGMFHIIKNDTFLTPFDMLCKIKHNNCVLPAFYEIELLIKKSKIPFIRVASDYFKVLEDNELIGYNKSEIRQDYGKDVFDVIKSYDKFGVFPDNINYKESIGNMLNTYHRPMNKAFSGEKIEWGDDRIKWSMSMLSHIFGDMLDLGIEYVQQLWCNPKQMLPILVLASVERQTGKTTFSNWLNSILGDNHVSLGLEDMKGDFNHFFAEKLLVSIEETQDESHKLVNKLKRISTTSKMLVNPKGVKQYVVDFYGKLIILTNSPDNFLKIDDEEIRFWVMNIPTLVGKGNHNIVEDLEKEIPFFLNFLENLPMQEKRSRMWFHPSEIITSTLEKVQKESKNSTVKDLIYLFENDLYDEMVVSGRSEMYFNATDIKDKYFRNNNLVTRNYLSGVLDDLTDKGLLNSSDKKIKYMPTIGDMSAQRVGKCYWLSLQGDDLKEAVLDNDDNLFF